MPANPMGLAEGPLGWIALFTHKLQTKIINYISERTSHRTYLRTNKQIHICMSSSTLRPRQNGCHFRDDIFKCIFLNVNAWKLIEFSLKFVPKGPINNIPSLFHIMAWCRTLSEPMMVNLLVHICVTRPRVNFDVKPNQSINQTSSAQMVKD